MCLSEVVRLVEVCDDGSSAIGEGAGGRRNVSLVVLALDGIRPAVGDWVVVSTGLAVERLTAAEAAEVTRFRAQMVEPAQEQSAPERPPHEEPATTERGLS